MKTIKDWLKRECEREDEHTAKRLDEHTAECFPQFKLKADLFLMYYCKWTYWEHGPNISTGIPGFTNYHISVKLTQTKREPQPTTPHDKAVKAGKEGFKGPSLAHDLDPSLLSEWAKEQTARKGISLISLMSERDEFVKNLQHHHNTWKCNKVKEKPTSNLHSD